MEDQVPFKVFTHWNEGDAKPEVRRFGIDKNVVTNFTYLHAKIQEIFPKLKQKTFYICWKDDEDDEVKISTDEEVMTMFTALRDSTIVKLYVRCEGDADTPANVGVEDPQPPVNASNDTLVYIDVIPPSEVASAVSSIRAGSHLGVCCDSCGNRVVGFRYKCFTCDDYDLCAQCEAKQAHPDHCFIRIPSAEMSLQVIRDSIKKSRHFLKSVAHDEHKKHKAQHHHLKAEMKKERHERRQERCEERRQERCERRESQRERPPRRSWMEVVSKYVDEFANLAGDFSRTAANGTEGEGQSSCPFAQSTGGQYIDFQTLLNNTMQAHSGNFAEIKKHIEDALSANANASAPSAETSEASGSEAPRAQSSYCANFDDIKKHIQNTMKGNVENNATQAARVQPPTCDNFADIKKQVEEALAGKVNIRSQAEPSTPQGTKQTASDEKKASTSDAITEDETIKLNLIAQALSAVLSSPVPGSSQVGQTPVSTEVTTPATPSVTPAKIDEPSVSNEGARDASPDKAEGWTLINKDKDLESDNDGAASAPIHTLPEEFQPRVVTSQLYPPLNTATAENLTFPVLNPVEVPKKGEPTQPKAKIGAGRPQQPQQPQSKPTAPAPEPPTPKPTPEPINHHPAPHINAAVNQMIAMGFTNEGGWLSQLLESKDGNIAAVLDLLTPVNPNRK